MRAGKIVLQNEIKNANRNNRRFTINHPNQGSFMNIGKTGYGKSGSIALIEEGLFDLRYIKRHWKVKIFDLFDGGRGENMFLCIPNNNLLKYGVEKLKALNYTPKAYPCNILYPMSKNLPNKIPPQGKVFTIPINSLDYSDLQALIGKEITPTVAGIWNSVFSGVTKRTTIEDLKQLIMSATAGKGKKEEDMKTSAFARKIIYGALGKLIENNLLSSGVHPFALDIKEECEDVDNISVLALKHIDRECHGFLVNHFISHVVRGLSMNKIKPPIATYFVMREVRELLKNDAASQSEAAIKESLSLVLAKWRTNKTAFVMDNQLHSTLTKDATSLPQKILLFQTDEARAILDSMGYNTRSGVLTSNQVMAIAMLPKLHCYVIDKDKASGGAYLIRLNPPRHRLFNSGERFDDVYNNLIGIWKRVGIDKDVDPFTPTEKENQQSKENWKLKSAANYRPQDAGKELMKQFKKIDKEKEKELKEEKVGKVKNMAPSPSFPIKEPLKEAQGEVVLKEDEEIYPPEIDLSKEPLKVNGAGIDSDDTNFKDEIKHKDGFEDDIKELIKQENNVLMKDNNPIKLKKLKEEDIEDFDKDFMNLLNED